jgi:glycosyltransferase involved in cell wall biosynthesis
MPRPLQSVYSMADENVPEITVIVPTYNVTKYIGQALDSILSQTFQNFEIVLVNDGCPDTAALEQLLEPYLPRIRYIKQANTGLSGACNRAIQAARGSFILHMDPDDWLEPACLEKQAAMLREHPEYDAAYCNSFNFAESAQAAIQWGPLNNVLHMDVYPSEGPVSFSSVMESRTCPRNPGSIARRETLLRVGLYDPALRCEEDLDMWLRILKADPPGRIGYTHEPLVHYRLRGNSLTMVSGHQRALVNVLEKAGRVLSLTPEERECLERRLALNRFDLAIVEGRKAIQERRWQDAIRNYEYCQQYRPSAKTKTVLALLRTFPSALPTVMRVWDWYLSR